MFDFSKISKGPEIIKVGMQLQSSVADYIRKDPINMSADPDHKGQVAFHFKSQNLQDTLKLIDQALENNSSLNMNIQNEYKMTSSTFP